MPRPDTIRKLATQHGDVYQKAIGVEATHLLVPLDFVRDFEEAVNEHRQQLDRLFPRLMRRAEDVGLLHTKDLEVDVDDPSL